MARMPFLAAVAAMARGRRHLVDLSATAPSAGNWPQEQYSDIPPWSSWSRETKNQVMFVASVLVFLFVCWCVYRLFCRDDEDEAQDTSRFVRGPWINDDTAEGISTPPSPPPPPPPQTDMDLAAMPAADVELALAAMELALAGVELAPAPDMEMTPPVPEPAPTLKCTFSTTDGWAEGTCSVCLSELVDGEKVRVLTACMHCFHARCVEKWLHENATCPLCRAPAIATAARGRRRRRRRVDPNLSSA